MPEYRGVHGSSGATEDRRRRGRAKRALPDASLDDALNERIRPMRVAGRSGWWGLLAAVIAIGVVVGIAAPWRGSANSGPGLVGAAHRMSIGLKLAPGNLDIRTQSGAALDQILIGNVYEGLVARDGENKVVPGLAESWDSSPDGLVYTFRLHRGMRFSNGHALHADDVAWSINELRARGYQDSEQLEDVSSVTAPDAATVRIALKAPYASLLWVLTGRPGLVFDRRAHYDRATEAVGSGPYTITRYVPNSVITLQADDRYWGARKARTARIDVRYFADDTAAVNALRSGDVQVLAPLTQSLAQPFVDDPAHYEVKVGEGTDKFVLAFNGTGAATSDLRVRQAIRYAIDRRQLIASRGGADAPLGGPIPSLDPGYEDLTGLYPHDPAKAKRLMAETGHDRARPLRLTLTYANIYGSELGDQLRSQLRPIGIDLHVEVVEFATWLQDVYTNHDYDLSLVDHNESHDFYLWADPDYYFGYDNPTVQRLYRQASRASNPQDNARILAQAARIVSRDAPADWLFNYRITTATVKGVQGFPVNLNQTLLPLADVTYTPGKE
jgi:peptide/nickel transport system substrate-binding protein